MSVNLRLIPTALKNGKEITAPRSQKNNQNSNSDIHSYRVIYFLASGNASVYNLCLQPNTVNGRLHNSLVINARGVA